MSMQEKFTAYVGRVSDYALRGFGWWSTALAGLLVASVLVEVVAWYYGFHIDPRVFWVRAWGHIDWSSVALSFGSGCVGFIAVAYFIGVLTVGPDSGLRGGAWKWTTKIFVGFAIVATAVTAIHIEVALKFADAAGYVYIKHRDGILRAEAVESVLSYPLLALHWFGAFLLAPVYKLFDPAPPEPRG